MATLEPVPVPNAVPRRRWGDPAPAGPADLHQRIIEEHAVSEGLPCADTALLEPLRVSPEFRGIRARLVHEAPVDTWREDGFHFFVFELAAAAEPEGATGEPPVAVFAVHADTAAVISAVTVEPRAGDGRTEITDLRSAGGAYTA